jgi:hypothetical protein
LFIMFIMFWWFLNSFNFLFYFLLLQYNVLILFIRYQIITWIVIKWL